MQTELIYFNGDWQKTTETISVLNPYSGEELARVYETGEEHFSKVIESAEKGFEQIRKLTSSQRAEILYNAAELLENQATEFAQLISGESGKAIKYARGEVSRAVENLRFAGEAGKTVFGEVIKADSAKGGINHKMFYERFPLGIIAAITPFNFPLNLVVHKLAPALVSGNSVILKPSSCKAIDSLISP